MTQATITFGELQTRVVNIVKGKYGLKNMSDAVNLIIEQYSDELMEPELRPEFVKRLDKAIKSKRKGVPAEKVADALGLKWQPRRDTK